MNMQLMFNHIYSSGIATPPPQTANSSNIRVTGHQQIYNQIGKFTTKNTKHTKNYLRELCASAANLINNVRNMPCPEIGQNPGLTGERGVV